MAADMATFNRDTYLLMMLKILILDDDAKKSTKNDGDDKQMVTFRDNTKNC